ncbi:hypothetical protein SPRG_21063 [Saprolegnia parasitica CBS 223.65]|uniref:Uncharacterized protein n=1 Tax=Saprolegnia parasitica (strain CBS 223.65) TaxID=695850 RepID=A0A067BX21_SAPPC|nr:hypothetical protein SPRG_21063 [Saprolegnia parasitica CBS 223.65]KDO23074.1 hypothetical protein SPRG_21063 [Saprolegnia parasitica CBS 223.65]|eukprot:XP_012206240.1 hypothetical protein SPRG_21063 [Saprolegnia parasitica CBS 223.65]
MQEPPSTQSTPCPSSNDEATALGSAKEEAAITELQARFACERPRSAPNKSATLEKKNVLRHKGRQPKR